ncbi:MAG: hypothetical protein LC715_05110 [Gammaproteobacteria bacterium]|nr:hypothetical protein [Gammaproteobacteria bacterium]
MRLWTVLALRCPALNERRAALAMPECHPLFQLQSRPVAAWERLGSLL